MKKAWLILLLLLFPALVGAEQPIGTLFTKVNTYVFMDGPQKGKRYLVRAREAVEVVGMTTDSQGQLWYQFLYPDRRQKVTGEGWTPLSPVEARTAGGVGVPVYTSMFEKKSDATSVVNIPAGDIEFLNVSQEAKNYPGVIWQKVRYSTEKPSLPWIRSVTGIYRPGKNKEFVESVYAEMVSRSLEKETLFRLIGGVVRVGDAAQQVQWALGKPLRIQQETSEDATRVVWHYASFAVRLRNEVVEQIN